MILDRDVLFLIFCKLDVDELNACSLCNRLFYGVSRNNLIWRRIYDRHFPNSFLGDTDTSPDTLDTCTNTLDTDFDKRDWREELKLKIAWKNGRASLTKTPKEGGGSGSCIRLLSESFLFVSTGTILKMFSIEGTLMEIFKTDLRDPIFNLAVSKHKQSIYVSLSFDTLRVLTFSLNLHYSTTASVSSSATVSVSERKDIYEYETAGKVLEMEMYEDILAILTPFHLSLHSTLSKTLICKFDNLCMFRKEMNPRLALLGKKDRQGLQKQGWLLYIVHLFISLDGSLALNVQEFEFTRLEVLQTFKYSQSLSQSTIWCSQSQTTQCYSSLSDSSVSISFPHVLVAKGPIINIYKLERDSKCVKWMYALSATSYHTVSSLQLDSWSRFGISGRGKVVTAGTDDKIRIWDVKSGCEIVSIRISEDEYERIGVSNIKGEYRANENPHFRRDNGYEEGGKRRRVFEVGGLVTMLNERKWVLKPTSPASVKWIAFDDYHLIAIVETTSNSHDILIWKF